MKQRQLSKPYVNEASTPKVIVDINTSAKEKTN